MAQLLVRLRWWWSCASTVHLVQTAWNSATTVHLTQRGAMKARDQYSHSYRQHVNIVRVKLRR